MGIAIPFVVLLPTSRHRASTALNYGGCDHGVMAAFSVPPGVRGSNYGQCCLVVSGGCSLPHGSR